MFEVGAIAYLWAETPVHAGSGSSVAAVDLPVQRERATHLPVIAGSGLKGCLRQAGAQRLGEDDALQLALFGPPPGAEGDERDHAGALSVGDARLLALPVRSLRGVFAWVTSPLALSRWRRDLERCGFTKLPDLPNAPPAQTCLVGSKSTVITSGRLVLEEFAVSAKSETQVDGVAAFIADAYLGANVPADSYWRQALAQRLVVVGDDLLADLSQLAMEVVTRVRLESETKTVARGALWTEEQLPAETLLYAPLLAAAERRPAANGSRRNGPQLLDALAQRVLGAEQTVLQVGGNETVGRGFMSVRLARPSKQEA